MKFRFSIWSYFIASTCVIVALAIPYWIPKQQVLSVHDAYVGYYRGLGITEGNGYFGRNWFKIKVDEGSEGYWEVRVSGQDYHKYIGYYRDGQIREEGYCAIEIYNNYDGIVPNRHDLLNAKFYDPNGKLISEVTNKTGKQILCYPNGQWKWELDLDKGKYAQLKTWHRNGQLASVERYSNGLRHGESVSFYSNGQIHRKAYYTNDKRSGTWLEYLEDGSLESETSYDVADNEF